MWTLLGKINKNLIIAIPVMLDRRVRPLAFLSKLHFSKN